MRSSIILELWSWRRLSCVAMDSRRNLFLLADSIDCFLRRMNRSILDSRRLVSRETSALLTGDGEDASARGVVPVVS